MSDRYVAEGEEGSPTANGFLNRSPAWIAESEDRTNGLGICAKERYCLGYSWLFRPAKPRLTDLLLALIAADEPFRRAKETIDFVQGNAGGGSDPKLCDSLKGETHNRCVTIEQRLNLRAIANYLDPETDCALADQWGVLRSQFTNLLTGSDPHPPRVQLACFARAARLYLQSAGLARAAVADFLFHYKQSQQYPHEFSAYNLNQSAANLNSALSPLIEAFNRDVVAFQTYMRTDVEYQVEVSNHGVDRRCCVKRLLGVDKPSFFNDGIVSVRTISGQATSVNTASQSFLDASQAPSISDLLSAVGTGATPTTASPLASALGGAASQAPISLLAGALSAYQKTYAQIGRQLQLQVVPRSLATASAAEISVYMKAGDSANGVLYSGGPSAGRQNTSQVSNHDVTTRIRVDSVKLFELSSYSAVLQRSRSKLPLLPPFVELPYIGTLIGVPMGAAKEYHASTAIISAMVVPTAADIGYGLRFLDDLVLYGPTGECFFESRAGSPACQVRPALSKQDLHAPASSYNDAMVLCLNTQTSPGRENLAPATKLGQGSYLTTSARSTASYSDARNACSTLTFRQFPSYE